MPEISESKYLVNARPCIMCGGERDVAYAYTTAQGKRSVRFDSRCKACNSERRKLRSDPAQCRAWREANRETHLEGLRRYRSTEEGKRQKAKAQRLRKARLRSGEESTPEIAAIYDEAMKIEIAIQSCPVFDLPELGKKMHVDHIIPLARGGRHEASNLQILAAGLNMRKGVSCPR